MGITIVIMVEIEATRTIPIKLWNINKGKDKIV